jgi:hypothetical protein
MWKLQLGSCRLNPVSSPQGAAPGRVAGVREETFVEMPGGARRGV